MTDALRSIELREFELVIAAPGMALLRIVALLPSGPAADSRPTLVVDEGDQVHRLEPLPAPPDAGNVLRAAFRAPVSLLVGDNVFTLELSTGAMLALPPPVPRPALHSPPRRAPSLGAIEGLVHAHDAAPGTEDEALAQTPQHRRAAGPVGPAAHAAAGEPAADRRAKELASELTAAGRRAKELEAELTGVRDQAARAHVRVIELEAAALEADTGFVEIQSDTERLVRRARELEAEQTRDEDRHAREAEWAAEALSAAEQSVAAANELAAAASLTASEAAQRAETMERRIKELGIDELEEAARASAARAEELERSLSESEQARSGLEQARSDLEQELSALTEARSRLEVSLARARDELRLMATERDELIRQVTAHDGVAEKARERARDAERAHVKADSTASELHTAYAELNQTLTDKVSDLEAARAGRTKAEREVERLQRELKNARHELEKARAQLDSATASED